MNKLMKVMALAGLTIATLAGRHVFADDTQKPAGTDKKTATVEKNEPQQFAYLGVAVESLHPAFWAHMKDVLEHKQGLLVAQVAMDSPAEKAGLKQHDILTMYADQKLFSPEQLLGLVHADKAGKQVKLSVTRDGKPQEITVTLGEHAVPVVAQSLRPMWHMPEWRHRSTPLVPSSPGPAVSEKAEEWTSFDSLAMKSLGNDRFKVDIGYETKEGKIEHQEFEGTRTEIREKILTRKDLPDNERNHLLRALDLPVEDLDFEFPAVYSTPDGRVIWDFGALDRAF
ncbi:MAG: PDZ domain-containing protein [Planctomycetaceae bacterium]